MKPSRRKMLQHQRNGLQGRLGMATAAFQSVAYHPMSTPDQIFQAQTLLAQTRVLLADIQTRKICLDTGEIIPAKKDQRDPALTAIAQQMKAMNK